MNSTPPIPQPSGGGIRLSLVIACALALAIMAPRSAQSAGLEIVSEAEPAAFALGTAGPTVIRERSIRIDAGPLFSLGEAQEIQLGLFEDRQLRVRRSQLQISGDDAAVWFGEVIGEVEGEVTLALREGQVAGTVRYGGELYQISAAGPGQQLLRQIDLASMPLYTEPSIPDFHKLEVRAAAKRAQAGEDRISGLDAPQDDGSTIDVLVAWTTMAGAFQGGPSGMQALIDLAIAESNQAYANSGITTQLNLVHAAEVSYIESGNYTTDLGRLRNPLDGHMDVVHSWRDTYKADIIVLISNGATSCGASYLMSVESTAFESSAFAVVNRTCATGYYSFSHEIGHVQGLQHERVSAIGDPAHPYGYGHQDAPNDFRTIMAYDCIGGCTRVQHFSNPGVDYQGHPTGIDHDVDPVNSADNARAMNDTAWTVANFRISDNAVDLPNAPSDLTEMGSTEYSITLAWVDNAADEDGFVLECSLDGVYGWQQKAVLPANSSSYVADNLPADTGHYFRIRAYNQNGDSDWSESLYAMTDPLAQAPAEMPSLLTANAISDTEIQLSWIDNSTDEGGFNIERSPNGDTDWTAIAWTMMDDTVYLDAELDPGTTYYYRIWAELPDGNTPWTNIASATTQETVQQDLIYLADGEQPVDGEVTGGLVDTGSDDGIAQKIREVRSSGPKSQRYSYLEHTWLMTIPSGQALTLNVNAWSPASSDGDQMMLAYSFDGVDYFDMFSIADEADWIGYLSYDLPVSSGETLYLRVKDSDRQPGNRRRDSVYIDHLFLSGTNPAAAEPQAPEPSLIMLGVERQGYWWDPVIFLTWNGAQGAEVEIYRDGSLIATAPNNGSYVHDPLAPFWEVGTYQICEVGGESCSEIVPDYQDSPGGGGDDDDD